MEKKQQDLCSIKQTLEKLDEHFNWNSKKHGKHFYQPSYLYWLLSMKRISNYGKKGKPLLNPDEVIHQLVG